MMRSAGVMAALFHRAAVIAEADSDRAFYDEVNKRLVENGRGVEDAVFLNANGKDSLSKIVGPLRRLGIPAAAIADLDLVSASEATWSALFAACNVPDQVAQSLNASRQELKAAFAAIVVPGEPAPIKRGGLARLQLPMQIQGRAWLSQLAAYGIFVPPTGELESWLQGNGLTGHGPSWLRAAFAAMGSDPTAANYMQPGANDVWEFLDLIRDWVANPQRLGT